MAGEQLFMQGQEVRARLFLEQQQKECIRSRTATGICVVYGDPHSLSVTDGEITDPKTAGYAQGEKGCCNCKKQRKMDSISTNGR